MKYTFTENLLKQGNRYFIKIPFNIWEECGQKGLVPVKVSVEDHIFECRLIPKGAGNYYIPVKKSVVNKIDSNYETGVCFEVINGLTRINHDSPYTKEDPIRKIDGIRHITYPKNGYCGQICIAMLTGLSVDEIVEIMQAGAWQCSFSKLIETLDYFGISHEGKIIYTKGREVTLPDCCIVNVKSEQKNHFSLFYKGRYYDTVEIDANEVIGYLRIII